MYVFGGGPAFCTGMSPKETTRSTVRPSQFVPATYPYGAVLITVKARKNLTPKLSSFKHKLK